jgi:hypothetical protein
VLIDIARRRQRPGTGSLPREKGDYVMQWPNLVDTLAGLKWAVVGAVAARNYMPERATRDMDILILAADSSVVAARLEAASFQRVGDLTIGGTSWRTPDGTPLDVIEGRDAWCSPALNDAATNLSNDGTPVLTAPYLVLMKLLSGRVQDIADVTRILGGLDDSALGQVEATIRRHGADLSEDLESLIALGKLEYEDGKP